ncbi:MAG TPA: hypothetical protein VLX91_11050 [Candidatus Acidoferrales bacterium]|nr:hypothetical protein [Candidatus Acidoferrales bacterium]
MCSRYGHWRGPRKPWWFIFGLPFVLLFLAIGTFVLMWLWNLLLPEIFGIKMITFWQALGLLILSKLLFGGVHRRPRPFYGHPRHWDRWKKWHEEEEEGHEGASGEEKTV